MIITTNQNVIYKSKWYKAGAKHDVAEDVGERLIKLGYAAEIVQGQAEKPAKTVKAESAAKSSKSGKRKAAAEVEDVEEAFTPIPEAE